MNSERTPNDDELWPPDRVIDQWPPEIDEQWPTFYLDQEEIRLAADQAGATVEARLDMGMISCQPFVRVRPGLGRFSDEFLDGLTLESARAMLQLMGHAYAQTYMKLVQFKEYVPAEIVARDPGFVIEIAGRVEVGQSDGEIAAELGETKKFVQRVRLALGRNVVDGPFKKTRGRPRKDSAA